MLEAQARDFLVVRAQDVIGFLFAGHGSVTRHAAAKARTELRQLIQCHPEAGEARRGTSQL